MPSGSAYPYHAVRGVGLGLHFLGGIGTNPNAGCSDFRDGSSGGSLRVPANWNRALKVPSHRKRGCFLVEDIPALVCDSCMEQFYDEETTEALRRLTEAASSSLEPEREIVVPVFSLEGRIRRREEG